MGRKVNDFLTRKKIYELKHNEKLTFKEISGILGISVTSVRTRYLRYCKYPESDHPLIKTLQHMDTVLSRHVIRILYNLPNYRITEMSLPQIAEIPVNNIKNMWFMGEKGIELFGSVLLNLGVIDNIQEWMSGTHTKNDLLMQVNTIISKHTEDLKTEILILLKENTGG